MMGNAATLISIKMNAPNRTIPSTRGAMTPAEFQA
jgi:hypothetical protein